MENEIHENQYNVPSILAEELSEQERTAIEANGFDKWLSSPAEVYQAN